MEKNSRLNYSEDNQMISNSLQGINCKNKIHTQKQHYFYELMMLQKQLNQQLVLNSVYMSTYLMKQSLAKEKAYSSNTSTNPSSDKNVQEMKNQKMPSKQQFFEIKQQRKKIQACHKRQVDQDYQPQQLHSNHVPIYRLSETKNVPKNYGKAILNFIKKHKQLTIKVLKHLNIDSEIFLLRVQKYRGKINTIADIRSLWLDQSCPNAKAFRILSMEYLRKHSLGHIFNSRVENFSTHVKYRYKIISGLEKPISFTQIKDF